MTTANNSESTIRGWLNGRLPAEWFTGAPEVTVDREEITVVGRVPAPASGTAASEGAGGTAAPEGSADPEPADARTGSSSDGGAERAAAEAGRIAQFRADTRDARIRIARELEHRTGRKVAWGAECGETRQLFTTLSVPVMTRLRQPERQVLDTLVGAGVARSRSDALAWCVKLVGQHSDTWLAELRDALDHVAEVRTRGPE